MADIRKSVKRDAVRDELCSRCDHPTAEELYSSLKEDYPQMGIATVYRNLSKMTDDKKAIKISLNGVDHYDGNTSPHYHLVCEKCMKIFDVDVPLLINIEQEAAENSGSEIFSHSITFFGICKNCRENNK